jgi:hypothetical protein
VVGDSGSNGAAIVASSTAGLDVRVGAATSKRKPHGGDTGLTQKCANTFEVSSAIAARVEIRVPESCVVGHFLARPRRQRMPRRRMRLRLKALANGEPTELRLTGVLATAMTRERRRRLLALASLWSQGSLDVVLAVDDEFRAEWCERWTHALEVVHPLLPVRFEPSGRVLRGGTDEQ